MKDFEEIRRKIKQKKSELMTLNGTLNELARSRYKFLVGKYFSLAGTCKIKVTEISCIDKNSVNVGCILVEGGKHGNGDIHIEMKGFRDLEIYELEKNGYNEITKDMFNEFIEECFEESKKTLETNE